MIDYYAVRRYALCGVELDATGAIGRCTLGFGHDGEHRDVREVLAELEAADLSGEDTPDGVTEQRCPACDTGHADGHTCGPERLGTERFPVDMTSPLGKLWRKHLGYEQ